jgi:hypothetical protein
VRRMLPPGMFRATATPAGRNERKDKIMDVNDAELLRQHMAADQQDLPSWGWGPPPGYPARQDMTRAALAETVDPPDEPAPHRASCLGSPFCQTCQEDCVTITWSEVRNYSATVHRSELAEAVSVPGSGNPHLDPGADGHAMPVELNALVGDPFTHGDLNGLLCDLEDHSFDDATDITVLSIEPAS